MNLEIIKQFTNAPVYFSNELPSTIGNAIYSFGSNEIREITAFIDTSINQDGSDGMIITPTHLYTPTFCFSYDEITSLKIDPKTNTAYINELKINGYSGQPLVEFLSDITELTVLLEGTMHEKIVYDLQLMIQDLEDEVYEDIELSADQKEQLLSLKEELASLSSLKQEDQNYEIEQLLLKNYTLFEELELDSDEMDELEGFYQQVEEKEKQQNQAFDQASHYYEDMINNFKNGDPAMFNRVKSIMKMMGINEDDLKNKSPEELDAMVDSLCQRFGVSRSQVDAFAKKFQK